MIIEGRGAPPQGYRCRIQTYVYMCLCVCMCACVSVCERCRHVCSGAHTFLCAQRPEEDLGCPIFFLMPPPPHRGSLAESGANLATSKSQWSPCLHLPQCCGYRDMWAAQLLTRIGDLNSSPQAWKANTYPLRHLPSPNHPAFIWNSNLRPCALLWKLGVSAGCCRTFPALVFFFFFSPKSLGFKQWEG